MRRISRTAVAQLAIVALVGAGFLGGGAAAPAPAAVQTWVGPGGGGGDGDWDTTSTNWDDTTGAPFNTFSSGDRADFDTNTSTITLTEDITASGVRGRVTNNNAGTETLTLNGSDPTDIFVTGSSGNEIAFNHDLVLQGDQLWDAEAFSKITFDGDLSGTPNKIETPGNRDLNKLELNGDNGGLQTDWTLGGAAELVTLGGTDPFGGSDSTVTMGQRDQHSWTADGGPRTVNADLNVGVNGVDNRGPKFDFTGNDFTFTGAYEDRTDTGGTGFDFQVSEYDVASGLTVEFTGSAEQLNDTSQRSQKLGDGTLIFSGNKEFVGAMEVNDGTLLINGTTTNEGSYTVASGATLGGDGTIGLAGGENVTVQDGGTISPGASPGTMKIEGDLVINENGEIDWEKTSEGKDRIDVTGDTQLPTDAVINFSGDTSLLNDTETIITSDTLSGETDLSGYTLDGFPNSYFATTSGNDLIVTIPEPSSFALLGLGGLALLPRRRKRRA